MLSLFIFISASCKKEEVKKVEEAPKKETIKVQKKNEAVKIGNLEIPKFTNVKLDRYASSYADYIVTYKEAYAKMQKGDHKAFNDLATKGQELATMGEKLKAGITGDDAKKLSDFLVKASKEISDIAQGK